jgi:hypothetical protein
VHVVRSQHILPFFSLGLADLHKLAQFNLYLSYTENNLLFCLHAQEILDRIETC